MTSGYTIQPLSEAHVVAVSELHQHAFPAFFLSSLGTPFLAEFYRGFLNDDSAVALVATDESHRVRGAVVGTVEPEGFFGRLLKRRLLAFVRVSAYAALTSPRTTPRLLRALRYRGDAPNEAAGALLSSICVEPSAQGTGLGSTLLSRWTEEVAARGARAAYLTTGAEDNAAVNDFYKSAGWRLDDHYVTRQGRPMNRYATTLGGDSC